VSSGGVPNAGAIADDMKGDCAGGEREHALVTAKSNLASVH
jgi:hypothetical protein